jgi:hypothetical protein
LINTTLSRYRYGPLLAAMLASFPALAQAEPRWFQVELLVFGRDSAATTERWDPIPELHYPGAARFLIEPARVAANLAGHHAQSNVDEFGRQVLTILADPGQEGAHDRTAPPAPAPIGNANPGTDPNTPAGTTTAAAPAPDTGLLPTPFVALPASQRQFRGKAAYMQRTGRFRTLFHQTWVQPVANETNALPIIVDRSGDTGQWPALQGSIKIYLSRYLHLETNLWLNTTGSYLPGTWSMPPPPLGPPSLIIEELPEPEPDPGAQAWLPAPPMADPTVAQDPNAAAPYGEEESGPKYPFRHAVLLQQKRRMRSTEVHYIDHPLLGVVVKVTPVDLEQLATMARQEDAAGQAL